MAELANSGYVRLESEYGTRETVCSKEHDRVPLKQRLKLILANKHLLDSADTKSEVGNLGLARPPIEFVVKEEDECGYTQGFYSAYCSWEGTSRRASSVLHHEGEKRERSTLEVEPNNVPVKLKTKHCENNVICKPVDCQNRPSNADFPMTMIKTEVHEDFLDDLDHIILKERQSMLLSRKLFGSKKPVMKDGKSNSSSDAAVRTSSTSPWSPVLTRHCQETTSICLSSLKNVKVEPIDDNDLQVSSKDIVGSSPLTSALTVKSKVELTDEPFGDIIDHMFLRERMKLLTSGDPPYSDGNSNCSVKAKPSLPIWQSVVLEPAKLPLIIKRSQKRKKTATDSVETALEEDAPGLLQVLIDKGVLLDEIKLYGEMDSDEPLDDSFTEESFAELEVVISKIFSQRHSLLKLAPIRCTKGERASYYCLACLISLVEQARYLQFRKWPVEWGWCRDLQSFIFVFKRHNRIVLERPEYGYATYFFELVDTLPLHWQIKRLVTAMKLTSCSRITLIENKALAVGDDLTEGEARVLMDYGWISGTGLGTMLNYCDRVVHDRKNEKDSSEWKSKIGKLLVEGYKAGMLVPTNVPKKVIVHGIVHHAASEIKLETLVEDCFT